MRVTLKSSILQMIFKQPNIWDTQLANHLSQLHSRNNDAYWFGTIRAYLAELNASGLITITNEYWHEERGKILFSYTISPFGLKRMEQTGLK